MSRKFFKIQKQMVLEELETWDDNKIKRKNSDMK